MWLKGKVPAANYDLRESLSQKSTLAIYLKSYSLQDINEWISCIYMRVDVFE
jgi:hypothetical protein